MSKTEELLTLAEAATPGEWGAYIDSADECFRVATDDYDLGVIYNHRDGGFIAAAKPATIKQLVELVRMQHEALEIACGYARETDEGYPFVSGEKCMVAFEEFEK